MYYNNFNNNNNGYKRRPKDLDYDGLFMEREERDPLAEFDQLFLNRLNDPDYVQAQSIFTEYRDKKRMETRQHTPLSADLSLLTKQDADEILAYNKSNLHGELFNSIIAHFGFNKHMLSYTGTVLVKQIARFQQQYVASHYKAKDENGPDVNGRIGPYTLAALKQAKLPVSEINKHYLKKILPKETLDKLESNRDLLNEVLLGFRVPQGMTAPIAPMQESEKNAVSFRDTVEHIITVYNEASLHDTDVSAAKQEALDEKINLPVDSIDKSALSGGEPLQANERTFFESKMNADFSDVKIHTDEKANESADSINADAYTVGSDIVFGKDKYQPGTKGTNILVAHELGHVGQQKASGKPVVQRQTASNQQPTEDDIIKHGIRQGIYLPKESVVTRYSSSDVLIGYKYTYVVSNKEYFAYEWADKAPASNVTIYLDKKLAPPKDGWKRVFPKKNVTTQRQTNERSVSTNTSNQSSTQTTDHADNQNDAGHSPNVTYRTNGARRPASETARYNPYYNNRDGISSRFGWRRNPTTRSGREFHAGVDFAIRAGERVSAVAGGIVIFSDSAGNAGNMVRIDHGVDNRGRRVTSTVMHNSVLIARVGQLVREGDPIAISGNTGRSTGAHVHFRIMVGGVPVDPTSFNWNTVRNDHGR